MKVISLQSGSNGNCFYVETDGVRLLFDAGISGKQADLRLKARGRNIRDVDALFISHDHSDHIRAMGVFQRKFGMPVYLTRATMQAAMRSRHNPGVMEKVNFFRGGHTVDFQGEQGTVHVHSVPTPHDAADGVAFVVENHLGQRVGVLTDLGNVFEGLREVLQSLDAVIIESNYCPEMLEYGPYPYHLKERIRGSGGHLSNNEVAKLLKETRGDRMKWACLCHLSEENNRPDVARRVHEEILGDELPIYVASRYQVSDIMEL